MSSQKIAKEADDRWTASPKERVDMAVTVDSGKAASLENIDTQNTI